MVAESLLYCEAVLAGVGALPKCPPNLALARATAADLRDRLQHHSNVSLAVTTVRECQ